MIKVMIVDDEIMVRIGMKAIIDWERYGFQVVADAENGVDALEKIEVYNPDVVFTDLYMDKMNGFELIQTCMNDKRNILFIVLSNYNDFNNVKKAMKLGAVDYIFKLMVKDEDLIVILNEIKEKRMNQPREKGVIEDVVLQNLETIKASLMKEIIESERPKDESILRKLSVIGVQFDFNRPFVILQVSINDYTSEVMSGKIADSRLLKQYMKNMITGILKFPTEAFQYGDDDLLFFISTDGLEYEPLCQSMGEAFRSIRECLSRYMDIGVTGVLSGICTQMDDISEMVKAGNHFLKNRVSIEYGTLYCDVRNIRREIAFIKEYVSQHLTEDLTVEKASIVVNMSLSHFSHVFKENMHISFIDYVNQKRIKWACDLLLNSELKINEIASKVGIVNYNYFSILFKKIVGVSPIQYRNDHSRSDDIRQ